MNLALPAWAVEPTPGTFLNGSNSLDAAGATINGNNSVGYFVTSGTMAISNATLQNFNTVGGSGSGGGAGLGGAIFVNEGSTVTLNNVNLLTNTVVGGQGGVGKIGGSLNGIFLGGTLLPDGKSGVTPPLDLLVGVDGTSGTKGTNGASNTSGVGAKGGNGGDGGDGGNSSPSLIIGVEQNTYSLIVAIGELNAAASNPVTANVASGKVPAVVQAAVNEVAAIAALGAFDKALADGQIGGGGGGGTGGVGGTGSFGYGGGAGGNGGDGGAGGANWALSLFQGGAAGGDAGGGGSGGLGGFGAGGGSGGNGGAGGTGASYTGWAEIAAVAAVTGSAAFFPEVLANLAGFDPDGNPSLDPKYAVAHAYQAPYTEIVQPVAGSPGYAALPGGKRDDGLDGSSGAGGSGGFGGGTGTSGVDNLTPTAGGNGGSGFGGAIFVRTGGTLNITGNALFDGNNAVGGSGQAADSGTVAGKSGVGAGSDLFMMTGATVNLNPGTGNKITFNGSIADDSAASILPAGGAIAPGTGTGASIHIQSGLVQFNGFNTYTGQTILEGGTLQAQDRTGINENSNVNFAGTATSDAVLMTNGDFTRYVGPQSNRVQWTGSGGFAAADGQLNVKLSNGQTMVWGSGSFVQNSNALIFGSKHATDKVNFENNINLSGGNRTILVKANDADPANNVAANVDWAVMNGVISNGSLTIGDVNHTGKVVLAGANTYIGSTSINAGTVELTGSVKSGAVSIAAAATLDSSNGGLDLTTAVTNDGTLNLGSVDDTIASLTNTGTINGTGTLTAATYNLNNGSVLNAKLGAGTLNTAGAVTLNGTVDASTINVAAGSTLSLGAPELILDTASVTVDGTLNLNGGNETFQTLLGGGTVNTNASRLIVTNGSGFTGTLNAPNTNLSGGSVSVGGGTTTTDTTTVDNNLTVTGGGVLDSNTITVNSGGTLDLTNGSIVYDVLNGVGPVGGTVNTGGSFTNPNGSTVSGFLTVNGDFINNGTLAPGASPGILAIVGNYVENATANMEIGGLAGPGVNNVPPGSFGHDQVTTTGTVTLNIATSVLNVQGFNGFLPSQGDSFQIIATNLGAPIRSTGYFNSVTFDADGAAGAGLPVTNAAVVFDVNTGDITATGLNGPTSTFSELGANANQSGAAAALFSVAFAAVGPGVTNQIDSDRTFSNVGFLARQIIDATGSASSDLAKYVPDYYGSISDYAFLGNQVLVQSIQDRVSPMTYLPAQISEDSPTDSPEYMSMFVGYTYGNQTTADNADVSRNDYYAGLNFLASEDHTVGIAGSMSEGSISAPLGNAESEGFGAMLFGRFTVAKSFTVFGSFGYYSQDFDLTRQTVNGVVTGSTDASSYVGFLGVQYKGWRVGDVSIAPRLSLTYSDTSVGGFSESGAIDALNVGGYSDRRFMAEAGLSALWSTELAGRPFSVELAAFVQQLLVNDKSAMAVNIASVPTVNYPVNFAGNSDTQAVVRFNTSYSFAKSISGYAGYEGHYGGQNAHYVKGGIRVNF
ncbi:MAG: hypothetical protein IAE77_21490 [Prosthecobacter sp.]|jgi:fibronectin-binding autotransporter adhesin|uniref:beta strand repeat-containing protein n=1 Tax=Prosthecobacter sp. TaxID=1965333 RepID=UPI0019F5D149|nr:hypothetical protein [Prosthecobacter sp.]MBE2286043.1 hypothetical protein [Prosthecobacter sp.]